MAVGITAAVAAVVIVVVAGIVWPGLDAKRMPPADKAVWALQTGAGLRYARVNTAIDELDTVRKVADPSAVVQDGEDAYLFSESFGRVTPIDGALPADLDDESVHESPTTPDGTVSMAAAGDWVAYRTDAGAVWAGTLSAGADVSQVDPNPDGDDSGPEYAADAIGVDDAGTLYSWSEADGAVLRYRISTGEILGSDVVVDAPSGSAVQLTAADGVWFLLDAAAGRLWQRGADASIVIDVSAEASVGVASATQEAAYVADVDGLVVLPTDGAPPRRMAGTNGISLGVPARPREHNGVVYAAWLGPDVGTLWSSDAADALTPLDYGTLALDENRRPVFAASDSSIILNETRSGGVWSVPDGALVASSQNWALDERDNPDSEPSEREATVVTDPKPPIAEPDAFGVRPGTLTALAVMLNDHDPNKDVLSIDPASVTGLDPGFGTVSITDNSQRLAVSVTPGATGAASFSYRVTDGTAADGLRSEPTTVTVTATPGSRNSAPQWCAVTGCLTTWPEPEVAPGGTVTVPVLNGWVDPDGDPVILKSVTDPSGTGAVATTPSGVVVYQHENPSITEAVTVSLEVTVSDTRGADTVKTLVVRVSPAPRLFAQSFAVVDSFDAGVTVDVASHITGTAGTVSLETVRVLDDAQAEAVATTGGTAFDFSAAKPGVYRVAFTVTDDVIEASATARITLLPPDAPARLATAPVVAFVHPNEDVTVDVFTAVSNPTRRVLLLSDVKPTIARGASMSVDVVAQNFLRITGTTADGAEGLLGTVGYTVSDGTDDAGARIQGEASVYLLPSAPDLAPIAVDDRVVVRAGAQVDIPPLDNDVAISGGSMTLNPATVASLEPSALAFASGRALRYLAPDEPGEYSVAYSVFSAGSPALADDATVHVSVIPKDANRSPLPSTLQGRVLSGEATSIPFRSFGVDPDGDDVALDRIVDQPASGSAALSADGESIVYTSAAGFRGQVSFTYRVTDGFGAVGVGSVKVGVLDEQVNPSPITFTDYVQVQAGDANSVRVNPTANDIDPTGGTMSVTDIAPDLVETLADGSANPEYSRLADRIASRSATQIVIDAGDDPATMSFLYDVKSSSGNTARGLIVVKVVREAVPDYPVIADTVLTAETRDGFSRGVDVVAGKVAWSGGDVSDLTLSLWRKTDGVSVEGSMIRGAVPSRARIIAFALSGQNAAGETVTSYGFLRIPGDDDLTLALRSNLAPQEVDEQDSVSWDMADLVVVPRGRTLEVGGDVTTSGARGDAVCVRDENTTIRYDAASGAPWVDACIVPVRVTGQEVYSYLSIPVRITPLDPQPTLTPASLTVVPGATITYDLRTMTSWQGPSNEDGIGYTLEPPATSFAVSLDGSVATITGADDAVPGAEAAAVVRVSGYPDVAPARILLRVGAAPSGLPRGGTVAAPCSQAGGSSCTIGVVGADGEVNPLPGTPLQVTDVRATGACVGVTFAVASSSSVTADWTADAPGGTCTATFSLRDAQGRVTAGDRDGALLVDLQGYPQTPAALSQVAYADQAVSLRVDPGQSRLAYPALSGFVVRYGGQLVATCGADGTCPVIAAPNGEERVYEASAVNAVGESRAGATTTAWAYDAPPPPTSITAEPVVTGGDGQHIAVRIEGIDPAKTGFVELTSPAGETVRVPVGSQDTAVDVSRYRIGTNIASPLTVTPFSRFEIPPGLAGTPSGAARTIAANGVGAPINPQLTLSSTANGDGTSTVRAIAAAAGNGDGSTLRFGIVPDGRQCAVAETGSEAGFRVDAGIEYSYRMCAESVYAGRVFGRTEATASVRAVQSATPPTGFTFTVDKTPDVSADSARWTIGQQPTSAAAPPRNNAPGFSNWPGSTVFDRDPGILVRWVHNSWGPTTDWAPVVARSGSAPYQVQARWSVQSCDGGLALTPESSSTNGAAAVSFDLSRLTYYDAAGAVIDEVEGGIVPIGAVRVEGIAVTVDWSAQGWGLQNARAVLGAACTPNIPPPPPAPETP